MINNATDRPEPADDGEVLHRLDLVESRRFRGSTWLAAAQVTAIAQDADERLSLLRTELARARREQQSQQTQIEMLRHGALPSHASSAEPEPMVVELTMQAQLEANRTISEASAEGIEILADARRQAKAIIAAAHRQAADAADAGVERLRQRIQHFETAEKQLREALAAAEEQARRCQAHLIAQADQMQALAAQIYTTPSPKE